MATTKGRNFQQIVEDLSSNLKQTKNASFFMNTFLQSIPLLSTVRVCLEAGILAALVRHEQPMTAEQIAAEIHSDSTKEARNDRRDFVMRMLRGVQVFGLVDETAPFTYQANELTAVIADPGFAGGFKFIYDDNMGPRSIMTEMVDYHKARGWRASDSGEDGPYQRSKDAVGMSSFQHWSDFNPIQASRLSGLMQVVQKHRVHYFNWFPKEALFQSAGSEKLVYVDVGGGRGHDIRALAQKYNSEDVRYILEDLPNVVEDTKKNFGPDDAHIELVPHNFFQPQPIKGAHVYYLHKIMHDWPDKDCCTILERIRDAMEPYSRIFICDLVLPNQGCTALQAAFDIDMLSLHSGAERDDLSWRRLIEKAEGLVLQKIWYPPGGEGEGVIEIMKG